MCWGSGFHVIGWMFGCRTEPHVWWFGAKSGMDIFMILVELVENNLVETLFFLTINIRNHLLMLFIVPCPK